MIRSFTADRYFDIISQEGINVILLHRGGELYREAKAELRRLDDRFETINFHCWECCVNDDDEAQEIQAIWFPQFRVFVRGSERFQQRGVVDADDLVSAIEGVGVKL